MVYLELVKIFPSRKLAKPLGFSWVIEPQWGSKEGGGGVLSIKKLLCLIGGVKERL